MTLANIGPTVSEPDGCEVWLWHEFGLFVADSEGILADTLTPQAVALLTVVNTDRLGSPPPLPASARGWTPLPAPPPAARAMQRSPPEQGGERGRAWRVGTADTGWCRRLRTFFLVNGGRGDPPRRLICRCAVLSRLDAGASSDVCAILDVADEARCEPVRPHAICDGSRWDSRLRRWSVSRSTSWVPTRCDVCSDGTGRLRRTCHQVR